MSDSFDPMNRSTPGLPVHHQFPEFTQTHIHRVSDAIQPSHPLSSPSPPAPIPPSIRVFSNESTLCMRRPKYWSFSFSIIPSKEHPGLISLRTDWLDLLAVQGTLKSLLQHHSSKASILQRLIIYIYIQASQVALVLKNLPVNAGDISCVSLIPGSGRFPEGGHGNPLQYSYLENPMDSRAWQTRVHGVSQSLI